MVDLTSVAVLCLLSLLPLNHGQKIQCSFEGNVGQMVFLSRPEAPHGSMCKTPREAITVKDPQYTRDSCTYRVNAYDYTVIRRARRSNTEAANNIAEWEYCSDPWNAPISAASFNRQVCQRNDQCYAIEFMIDMVRKLGGNVPSNPSCSQLVVELKRISEPFLQQIFAQSSDTRCDFGEIITGARYITLTGNMVPGNVVPGNTFTMPNSNPNPNSNQNTGAIDACRNGVFNKVFYTNDEPTHCVINDKSEYRGKCIAVGDLHDQLKIVGQQKNKIGETDDNTIEYKRYTLQYRSQIYERSNKYDGFQDYWNKEAAFNVLFRDASKMFTETHPEVHLVTYGGGQYGAKTFCDVGLSHFPVKNTELYDAVKPQDCPQVQWGSCSISQNRPQLKFPTNVNLVYYTSPTNSVGCYVPSKHTIFNGYDSQGKQCITFEAGEKLISEKDAADRDEGDFRRHYMAGALRLYDMSEIPRIRIEPNIYHWNILRQDSNGGPQNYRPKPIGRLLQEIEAALGYEDDPKRIFNINEKLPVPKNSVQVQVPLSVQAFCAAIVEMIPFPQQDLRNSLSACPSNS